MISWFVKTHILKVSKYRDTTEAKCPKKEKYFPWPWWPSWLCWWCWFDQPYWLCWPYQWWFAWSDLIDCADWIECADDADVLDQDGLLDHANHANIEQMSSVVHCGPNFQVCFQVIKDLLFGFALPSVSPVSWQLGPLHQGRLANDRGPAPDCKIGGSH